jgi:hypothetical protein
MKTIIMRNKKKKKKDKKRREKKILNLDQIKGLGSGGLRSFQLGGTQLA